MDCGKMNSLNNNGPIVQATSCRCCGSIRSCRIFDVEYEFKGRKENYSQMMLKCFALSLFHADDNKACICAMCVARLRDAYAFKEQVLKCEAEFLKTLDEINEEFENLKKATDEDILTEVLSNNGVDYEELENDTENSLKEIEMLEEKIYFEQESDEMFEDDDTTYEGLETDLDEVYS